MGKMFRSLRGENARLFSGVGALLAIVAVFLISVCTAWITGAESGDKGLLPAGIKDRINTRPVHISEKKPDDLINEEIQEVISNADISNSDISETDMISDSDAVGSVSETFPKEDKPAGSFRDAYRERYSELTRLNDEYVKLIESSSGRERQYYTVKQQECVREAYIINACLTEGKEAGYSKAWNTVYFTLWLMLLPIGIFSAAAIASKTAGEFKSGVMYTLYTLPITRLKQFFAKLMSVSIFALMLCAAAWTGALFGAIFGCGGLRYEGELVVVLGEKAQMQSFFVFSAELLLCVFISTLILIAFCAAVSTLTRSQSAAIALTALLCAAAMLFGKAAGGSGNIIAALSVVASLDVSAPLRGVANFASASHVVAWLAAAVHWLVFVICGYIGMRRDVR